MQIRFADPEFARSFEGYLIYFEDLAGSIGGAYGLAESLAAGVHDAVLARPAAARASRRPPSGERAAALREALHRSWAQLDRAHTEVEDPEWYDVEANAFLPTMCHYSVLNAISALAVASHQPPPRDAISALSLIGSLAATAVFPYPWGATCSGCPQTGSQTFTGLGAVPQSVHVHSAADPSSSVDRYAMFLRTTRAQALERCFAEVRRQPPAPGKSRRNVSRTAKEVIAAGTAPTTFFDILGRTRREALTDDVDRFVAGAADDVEARRFAEALVIVTDATVAAIEAVIAASVGATLLADVAEDFFSLNSISPNSRVGYHATAWRARSPAR